MNLNDRSSESGTNRLSACSIHLPFSIKHTPHPPISPCKNDRMKLGNASCAQLSPPNSPFIYTPSKNKSPRFRSRRVNSGARPTVGQGRRAWSHVSLSSFPGQHKTLQRAAHLRQVLNSFKARSLAVLAVGYIDHVLGVADLAPSRPPVQHNISLPPAISDPIQGSACRLCPSLTGTSGCV